MKIYTRTGDDGSTGIFGGGRVEKSHPRIRAYGTVDEVNSALGTAVAHLRDEETFGSLRETLLDLQQQLFVVGADLATPIDAKVDVPRIGEDQIAALEHLIDRAEEELSPLAQFILPGGHPAAAALHVARTTCRRAEREVVEAMHVETLNPLAIKFLNRLSDFLFVAARVANHRAGIPDVLWNR